MSPVANDSPNIVLPADVARAQLHATKAQIDQTLELKRARELLAELTRNHEITAALREAPALLQEIRLAVPEARARQAQIVEQINATAADLPAAVQTHRIALDTLSGHTDQIQALAARLEAMGHLAPSFGEAWQFPDPPPGDPSLTAASDQVPGGFLLGAVAIPSGDTSGVTDSNRIQNLIGAVAVAGGGVVRLSALAGIGNQFYTLGLTLAPGVTLDMGACTLNLVASATSDAISIPTGTTDAWVQNGAINVGGLARAGVRITSTTPAGIARCGVLGPMHITNGAPSSISSVGVIATSDSVGVHPCDVLIDRVSIDNMSIGIDIRQCDGAKVTRCSILSTNTFWGISDHGCQNALIAENRVANCVTQGIVTYVDGTVVNESTAQNSVGSCVIGNLIQNCGTNVVGNLGWGINPSARSRAFIVADNIIRGCYQGGITADVPVTASGGLTTTVNGAGQVFPTGTLLVASSVGFDVPGQVSIAGVTGQVAYTGIGAGTSLTGCTGGTGTATNGGLVSPKPLINQNTDGTITGNMIDGFSGGQITLHLVSGASGSTILNFTYNGPPSGVSIPSGIVFTTAAVNFGDSASTIQTKLNGATGPGSQALPANAFTVTGGPFGTSDLTITGNSVAISQVNQLGHADTTLVCQFIPGNASGQTTWSNGINTNYAQGLAIAGNIVTGAFLDAINVFGTNIAVSGNTIRGANIGVNVTCLIGDPSLPARGGHTLGSNNYNSCATNLNQSQNYRSDGFWFPAVNAGPDIYIGARRLRAGAFYSSAMSSIDSTFLMVDQTLYAEPFQIDNPFGIVIATLGIEVTTVGSAGSVIRLGIYFDGAIPTVSVGQLMFDLGTISGTSATFQTVSCGKLLLPNRYWLAVVSQGAPATNPTVRARVGPNQLLEQFTGATQNSGALAFTGVGAGALPATVSAPNNSNTAPKILVGT